MTGHLYVILVVCTTLMNPVLYTICISICGILYDIAGIAIYGSCVEVVHSAKTTGCTCIAKIRKDMPLTQRGWFGFGRENGMTCTALGCSKMAKVRAHVKLCDGSWMCDDRHYLVLACRIHNPTPKSTDTVARLMHVPEKALFPLHMCNHGDTPTGGTRDLTPHHTMSQIARKSLAVLFVVGYLAHAFHTCW